MWEGKVTKELKDLYKQYYEIFQDGYPDEYAELENYYNDMSYEEFVEYIKECIKQKKEMPDIVLVQEEIEKKEMLERFKLVNKIYLQYIATFGELPEDYREIEGYQNLSDEEKKKIEDIASEEMLQYVEKAIKRKEKDIISDCLAFAFKELISEVTLDELDDDDDDW